VFGEGELAEYFYQVVSGAVCTYTVLQDGRRQIGAFHLPGDLFGIEAGEQHAFGAEAIAGSVVRLVRRTVILALAIRDSDLATDLFERAADSLRQAHQHMLLLGRKNAEERVASFLLDMARRRRSVDVIDLPMSRQDIADYLGLTIETVSRTLTGLESKAVIDLPSSRRIHVRSPGGLQRLDA
jgi:CRP-like cAMP-binding protein